MSSNFYRSADAPKYILGHALELSFVAVGLVSVAVLRWRYQSINRKREAMPRGEYTEEEQSTKGDRASTFRYVL